MPRRMQETKISKKTKIILGIILGLILIARSSSGDSAQ